MADAGTTSRRDDAPDAIAIITEDHQAIDGLFRSFEAGVERTAARDLVMRMAQELRRHARMEEEAFYPAVRELVAGGDALVDEGLEEHGEVKELLADLERSDPAEPGYDAVVATLISSVRHHVNEEEGDVLPKLRAAIGQGPLQELGRRLDRARRRATASRGGGEEPAPPKASGQTVADELFAPPEAPARGTSRPRRSAERRIYEVMPTSTGRWAVQAVGAKRPSSTHDRKDEAVDRGRELARRHRLGQLVVHRRDGTIQTEHTYGADPRRSPG